MASLILTPENQIQRLNKILNKLDKLRQLTFKQLTSPPHSKSWSVLEIMAHLNIAYSFYVEKIDATLNNLPEQLNNKGCFKTRYWQRFIIEHTMPKGGNRKWKMKTLKKFEPILETENLNPETVQKVFEEFSALHLHLKNAILHSRSKDVTKIKLTSAIGPVVNFYLPECFEFLLVHIERHLVQIDEVLEYQ